MTYLNELIRVPGLSGCAGMRGEILNAAKQAHGDFYAFCIRNAPMATDDDHRLTADQIAAFFAGANPATFWDDDPC